MGTDVLFAEHRVEAGLVEHGLHLLIDTGEDNLDALTLRHETEVGEVVDARGIDKGHLTHTDDADTGLLPLMAQHTHDLLETVTGTEEVGTVDLVDLHTLGDGEVLKVTQLEVAVFLLGVDLVADDLDVGGLSHTAHEEQTGTNQAHLDGNGEVEDDRQQEGDPEHDDIALRVLQDGNERAPAAHVIAHDDEHTGQTGHGDILRQRHEEEEDEQQHSGVDDAGNGRAAAVVDVGHRTGDGTRGRYAAEDGRRQVGQSLGDEFCVGAMAVADDTVGHCGREQRLDGTEDGDGDGGRDETLDDVPRQVGHLCLRQRGGDGEAVADGLDGGDADILFQQGGGDGHQHDGNQRAGQLAQCRALRHLRPEGDDGDGTYADKGTPALDGRHAVDVGNPLLNEIRGYDGHRQAEQILDLRGEDGEGDTAGEAHDDGVRDVLDDRAQMQYAEHDEEDARHERGDGQTLEAVLLDDAIYNNNERTRRTTDLYLRASEDGDDETGYDGGDDTLLGRHARGDTEGDGQRQGDDAHDDTGQQVGRQLLAVVMLKCREQFRLKCQ